MLPLLLVVKRLHLCVAIQKIHFPTFYNHYKTDFSNVFYIILKHIFQKAQVTSNKMEPKKRHHFSGPVFHGLSCGVVRFVPTVSFWNHHNRSFSLADGRVLTYQKVVSGANTRNKTDNTTCKGTKNPSRKLCFFLGSILFEVASPI